MAVRGIRGATTVDADTAAAIGEATAELLLAMVERNRLDTEEIASVWFTTTPDLTASGPLSAILPTTFTEYCL